MVSHFRVCLTFCFPALILLVFLPGSLAQLSSSETRILLQLKQHLEYPDALQSWNTWTNFCYLPYSRFVTVLCLNGHVTEITVIGNNTSPSLSQKFSIDSLFTDLTKLPNLKNLSLVSLGIWGSLPTKITRFQSLQVLNFSSNFIYGEIPSKIASLKNLKILALPDNLINGSLPDLSGIPGLQEVDLSNNQIGPNFPSLGTNLVSLSLRNNSLRSRIPTQMRKQTRLQRLDFSSNHLVGPIPPFIFSLTSLWYLNLAENQLTGELPKNMTCGKRLWFVNISRNLLTGNLPSCIGLESSKYRKVLSVWNCLEGSLKLQHPSSFCEREALAVIPPHKGTRGKQGKSRFIVGLFFGVIGATVLLAGTVGLLLCIICKRRTDDQSYKYGKSQGGKVSIRPPPAVDSKYVPRTTRTPAVGLPSYQDFALEDLEEATNNFDQENLLEEGSQGQIYRGRLRSGSAVLVRCIKVKDKHSSKILAQQMEVISKLRHQNLVSVLGHCVVTHQDRHTGCTIFIVFEHVTNGTLREHLTDWKRKERLKWPQRMTISMGIARGVHFLHTGMGPAFFGNDLKIECILLDESLTPKVGNYRIPFPYKAETPNSEGTSTSVNPEKDDIYNFGVILLELLTGRQVTSDIQLEEIKKEMQISLSESATSLQQAVDLSMRGTFAYQSIKTAVEITLSCLRKEPSTRPSMEDVLWHLQYSIQAQQAWTSSGSLALNSGNLGLHR